MPICDRFAVAVLPYPFGTPEAGSRRPALALTTASFMRRTGYGTFAMITMGGGTRRVPDLTIRDWRRAGVVEGSLIRWKLFTVPESFVLRQAGQLGPEDAQAAELLLRTALGLHMPDPVPVPVDVEPGTAIAS